jgi:hypothetical protein
VPQLPKPTAFDGFSTEDISGSVTYANAGAIPTAIRPPTEQENNNKIDKEPEGSNDMVVKEGRVRQVRKKDPDRGNEKDQNCDPPSSVGILLLGYSPDAKDHNDNFLRVTAEPKGASPVEEILIKESQPCIDKSHIAEDLDDLRTIGFSQCQVHAKQYLNVKNIFMATLKLTQSDPLTLDWPRRFL